VGTPCQWEWESLAVPHLQHREASMHLELYIMPGSYHNISYHVDMIHGLQATKCVDGLQPASDSDDPAHDEPASVEPAVLPACPSGTLHEPCTSLSEHRVLRKLC
jgi:hypothetical protein